MPQLNAAELLVSLARAGHSSLRVRLADALRAAVHSGQLAVGTTLPSSRMLATDLAVSRGVVVDAYAQLVAEGLLYSRPGAATVVACSGTMAPPRTHQRPAVGARGDLDLRPGSPDLAAFPRATWARLLRQVLLELPDTDLGYGEPWGPWELRRQLASYLGRVRNAVTQPDGLVAVGGVTQGVTLLSRILVSEGRTRIAVEDPSNAIQSRLLRRLGVDVVHLPVDDEGLDVSMLDASNVRAVLCTPAHQYPSGVVMSQSRREQLIGWARASDGLVIEDDYDSEFRYDREPMPCLQGVAPDVVALLGSVSKTLAPALRLGWMVPPAKLLPRVRQLKHDDDFGGNTLEALALARALELGTYDRHIRTLRRRYRERRDAFTAALARDLPTWTVVGSAGGLHLTVLLPPGVAEGPLVAAVASLGLLVIGIGSMSHHHASPPGIVISYASATPDMSRAAVSRLVEAARLTSDFAVDTVADTDAPGSYSAHPWSVA